MAGKRKRQSKSRSSSASTKKKKTNTMASEVAEVAVAEETSVSNRVPSSVLVELVEDSYLAALIDEDELFPISDEKYSYYLTFQECLFASIVSSSSTVLSENKDCAIPSSSVMKMEKGESSKTFCIICMDAKPTCEIFGNDCCSHSFCRDCISTYVAAKIQENIIDVKCPEPKCAGVLEPCSCRSIIPKEVLDRWEAALCESLILGPQKFYCPFTDCSALMESGGDADDLTACECPYCHRLFCARCKVPWHCEINCEMFQNLREDERGNDDIKAIQLAKVKDWKRCPKCSFYVEKTSGCMHILCSDYKLCAVVSFAMVVELCGVILIHALLEQQLDSGRYLFCFADGDPNMGNITCHALCISTLKVE
ncbi:IBR domain [Dillenia turbinata]|uniref:RBR-type E3 ubiquitin transferase n=1 Tax=Dillenia turbinata TaxID=194707 RepID=A0AAN8YT94_9MAGN